MIKKLIKFSLFFITILIIVIIYLSIFGINTKKFNDKVKSEFLNINNKASLELKSLRLLLNPLNLSINVKTTDPVIVIRNNAIELEFIKTNIPIKSFLNKKFTVDSLRVSTKKIKLNDIILLSRLFNNSAELFILNNIIKDGFLVGDLNLNFDNKGNIKEDYEIKGFIKKGKIDILKKYSVDDLSFTFNIKSNEYYLGDIEGDFNQIRLFSPLIKIKKKNGKTSIDGKLVSKKNSINADLLNNLFENKLKNYGLEDINFSSDSNFVFSLNKKFKISNLDLNTTINLDRLIYKNDSTNIKSFLPNYKDSIKLEDHKISINYKNDQLNIGGRGKVIIEDKADNLDYSIIGNNEEYIFDTNININKNKLLVNTLQYEKKEDIESLLRLKGVYKKSKKIEFDLISFVENKNNIIIKNLNLNSKFDILDIEKLSLNYDNINNIKNEIILNKNKNGYDIYGKILDASKLIDDLLNDEEKLESASIFNNLNTILNIKIKKTYLDKTTFVNDLNGNIIFKKNKVDRLNLKSNFPNNKKIILTINTNESNEKITTLFSDYPKPIVRQYEFIKGFEEGILDFYSIKKDNVSNSVLKIDNFKLQELPVLAKLLTLASLQGIADILTGEGIRFSNFELKFSNEKGLMKIDEMYAIGPAISILMDGYIESKKLISLRGTLVPATTINKTIAAIPLIGNILVGKKTGEGVFGVSFKVKGSPKNLKTSVNPIKTLTPRFITRTLEKIKRN